MLRIHQIINFPVLSNCYIISSSYSDFCIVIDPGTEKNGDLLAFLSANHFKTVTVILTHEHYDHCAGVNQLIELYKIDLICSEITSTSIANSKLNFSEYMEEYEKFTIHTKAIIVNDNAKIELDNCEIQFIETPGHSPGSLCIILEDAIFTGDTFMGKIRTPLKLPGGNKEDYQISLGKLKTKIKYGMTVYPGHGEPFLFQGFDHLVNSNKRES